MTQAYHSSTLVDSRLVRYLSELSLVDVALSRQQFTGRLGQLIDLSDSISIAAAHRKPAASSFWLEASAAELAIAEFTRVRTTIVQSVIDSFDPASSTRRAKLPQLPDEIPDDEATVFEAYRRFYVSHQRDIDFRVQGLYRDARTSLAGHSPEMAQLCKLDAALAKILAIQTRRSFATMSKLLQRRFEVLLDNYRLQAPDQQSLPHYQNILRQFSAELRDILLAEVEARLLPIQGLIESIDQTTTQTDSNS
jgi:hypothetical protein